MEEWWGFWEEKSIYEIAEAGGSILYVANLEPTVTEYELFEAFSHECYVISVRICRDLITGRSLGYGYVIFDYPPEARRTIDLLNCGAINGKDIRVVYYVHNPSLRKRGVGNIFIKNLEKSIDHKALYETFSSFGTILRFKVATDASGQSKGFGFVQYKTEKSAQYAVKSLNGWLLNEEKVYIGPFLQRDSPCEKEIFTDVYVSNLSKSLRDEELNRIFQEFGPTKSCVIIRDDGGFGFLEMYDVQVNSKGYGFVNFENPEDAEKAVEALNGKKFGKKAWFVAKSKKKYQRESEVKRGLKDAMKRTQSSSNLCIKNLHKSVTDESLKDFFSTFGTITSCKVMRDSNGVSKRSGFVAFSKREEASKAMDEINGKMKIRKQAYVDLATSLANATPEEQRTILGENLYPIVEQLEPESAEKITGMLLEMDHTQVLHLLESLSALESKVTEAMEILRTVDQQLKHSQGVEKSTKKHSVSDHPKQVMTKSCLGLQTLNIESTTSNRVNKRHSARADKHKSVLENSAVLHSNGFGANETKVREAMEVVRSVNQQQQQYGGVSESLSPSFKSPKPNSLARVKRGVLARERPDVSLTKNRFDSLKESEI